MIKIEELKDVKLVKFVDDRRYCQQCKNYVVKPWRGKCNAGQPQFNVLHRCHSYADKTTAQSKVWNKGDKPFWL